MDLVRHLESRGVAAAAVARAIGFDCSALPSPHDRVPGAVAERLWEAGVKLSGDADLGLHTAENFNPGALDLLGYVLLSCRTGSEALDRLTQYAALLNDGLRVEISRRRAATECRFVVVENRDNYLARAPRQAMETMACGTVVTLRRLTSQRLQPLAVTFAHARPASTAEHERIFGPVCRFGADANTVVFPTPELEATLLSANPALLDVFESKARELLAQLEQQKHPQAVSRRVLAVLARRIAVATPSLEEVAVELAMSVRTLQRELRAERTTFRTLVEDTRRALAMQHLAQPGASASEAAYLLGFSEPSAFTRAFRRWTGVPPTQFRAGAL